MTLHPKPIRESFSDATTERLISRFRTAYLWILGLVVGLILMSELMFGLSATASRNGEGLINVAGRQRMLSQRIAKHAFEMRGASLAGNASEYLHHRDLLSADLATLVFAHSALLERDSVSWIWFIDRTGSEQLLGRLTPRLARIEEAAEALMRLPTDATVPGPTPRAEIYEQLVRSCDAFLPVMHELVNEFESELETSRARSTAFHISLGFVTLVVLGIGVLFVLEPAHRRMIGQQRALMKEKMLSDRAAAEVDALRSALDEHSIVSITDKHGTIIDVNAGFCAISGFSREELIGQNHRILNTGHHPRSFWRNMWLTVSSGRVWRGEVCNTTKDGSAYWVDSTIVPYMDPEGKPERYVSIRFDITESKRAFRELEDAQALLARTGETANIGGWEMDLQTMTPVWSDEVCRIHEVPLGHVPSLDEAVSYYVEDVRDELRAAVENSITSGKGWDLELPIVTAKGNSRWVRAMGTPVMRNGECVKLWGALQDVTNVVETRERLETLRRRFERATSGATDGLWEYDVETGRVWCSEQFERMLCMNASSDEAFAIDYESFTMLIHPDDRDTAASAMRDHLKHGTPYNVKFRIRAASGSYRWFNARGQATPKEVGPGLLMSGSLTDIHDMHTAQTRLDLATRSARIGLWDWDLDSDSIYFNDTYGTMLGYKPGELDQSLETWKWLLHPDDIDHAIRRVEMCASGEAQNYSNEFRCRCKDRTWRWIRAEGEVVERAADGRAKRMTGVHIDIQSLREAMESARSANVAKSEFLANMSHEIRTPMTSILGYADLLDRSAGEMPELRRHAQTIRRNAEHLTSIINDILDVSKIEAGQMRIESIPLEPRQIVEEVAGFMRPKAEAAGSSLRVIYGSAVPESVVSDPLRLRQILLNLVGNAVKFTEKGEVTVTVTYTAGEELMKIEVRDTGIGMTPEHLQIIRRFEAFKQADSSTSRKYGGTGLGLRISNSLIKLLGGRIDVESEYGVGSRFIATIPMPAADPVGREQDRVADGSEHADEPPAPESFQVDLGGVAILLVEDGPDNQRLLRHLLETQGASVEIVETGDAAVRRLTTDGAGRRPDIVLMDMQMPVLDGFEATRQLRDAGYAGPIFAVTADAMDGVRERCMAVGCDEYLTKPIDNATLFNACAKWSRHAVSRRHNDAA